MSGIYIPGMKMPKGLGKTITIYPNGMVRVWVNNKGSGELLEQRAIPVPDHGRLIDADELLALVYENIALFDSAPGRMGADQKLVRAWLASMADDINDAPTVIPAKEGE